MGWKRARCVRLLLPFHLLQKSFVHARQRACLSAYFAMCNFMQLMFMQLQRYETEVFYLSLAQLCADLCVGKSAPISSLNWGGSNILLVLVRPPRQGTFQESGMNM